MGQRPRHPDEARRARALELEQRLEAAVALHRLPGRGGVELQDVEVVGAHAREALLDAAEDVVARENVRARLPAWGGWRPDDAAALARQVVFAPPVGEVAADPLLAHAIVD